MNRNIGKLSIVFIGILIISLAYANVTLEKSTEIELVDRNNSSIFLGQNYTFDENVTVYGDYVEFQNNGVTNNLTVYPNNTQEINSTLYKYNLTDPPSGEVFKIETEANAPVTVTYEVDAEQVNSGEYKVFDDNGDQVGDGFDGSSTETWTEDNWSNNTFTIEYTGNQVNLNWTDESSNENQFNVYSNSSGQGMTDSDIVDRNPEVTENSVSGTGNIVSSTHSANLTSGKYVCYKVTASNEYGESDPTPDQIDSGNNCVSIP